MQAIVERCETLEFSELMQYLRDPDVLAVANSMFGVRILLFLMFNGSG